MSSRNAITRLPLQRDTSPNVRRKESERVEFPLLWAELLRVARRYFLLGGVIAAAGVVCLVPHTPAVSLRIFVGLGAVLMADFLVRPFRE